MQAQDFLPHGRRATNCAGGAAGSGIAVMVNWLPFHFDVKPPERLLMLRYVLVKFFPE